MRVRARVVSTHFALAGSNGLSDSVIETLAELQAIDRRNRERGLEIAEIERRSEARPLAKITLHAGRPAGVNEPTEEGVAGVERMLALAATMTEGDVCVVLLSGGGSALLPAPAAGITLADKQAVTRWLMSHGASIEELNAVRGSLSRIKQGGLVRVMPAGRCLALIISDVIGDPLPVIASGPSHPSTTGRPTTAIPAATVIRR